MINWALKLNLTLVPLYLIGKFFRKKKKNIVTKNKKVCLIKHFSLILKPVANFKLFRGKMIFNTNWYYER